MNASTCVKGIIPLKKQCDCDLANKKIAQVHLAKKFILTMRMQGSYMSAFIEMIIEFRKINIIFYGFLYNLTNRTTFI